MFEEARAMQGTIELCRITQSQLAKSLGVTQSYVANKLRLLKLSDKVQGLIIANNVNERIARTLLQLEDEQMQLQVLDKVIECSLTVRECEAMVNARLLGTVRKLATASDNSEHIDVFARMLKDSVDTLVSLGVDAKQRISIQGKKLYITVCINGI